jgi:hypothetical protein
MAFFQIPNVGSVPALSVQFGNVLLGDLVHMCVSPGSPDLRVSGYAVWLGRKEQGWLSWFGAFLDFPRLHKSDMILMVEDI